MCVSVECSIGARSLRSVRECECGVRRAFGPRSPARGVHCVRDASIRGHFASEAREGKLPTVKAFSRYVSSSVAVGGVPRGFARTIAFKAAAEILSKTVTLIVTVAAARLLPAADFGVLAIAMTTGWILSVASDAGLPLFLAKRMAGLTGAASRSRLRRLPASCVSAWAWASLPWPPVS